MDRKTVWILRGYRNLPDVEAEVVYTHAFATKAEALEIYRRGTAELPHIYWEINSLNYGHMEFANHVLDLLKRDESHELL